MGGKKQGMLAFLRLSILSAVSCGATGAVIHYDVPAGEAHNTLRIYIEQTPIEMLYLDAVVRGIRTNSLHGDYEPPEALRRLLEGTGLIISFTPDGRFATIKPPGDQTSATPSPRNFRSPLTRGTEQQPAEEPTIEITGTRLRGVEAALAPIIQRSPEERRRTTYATTQDVLQTITQASLGGPSELLDPGGNYGLGTGIDLRGLGASATLVLLDGRRQAPSGTAVNFTDVSHIPWAFTQRVEVVPEGASAIYGSDAIAGVVNITLRHELDGAETVTRWGSGHDGADERLIAQLAGTHWSNGSILAGYQFTERSSLAARNRWYSRDSDKTPLGGSNFRSILSSPGNVLDPQTGSPVFALPSGSDLPNLENRQRDLQLLPDARMHSGYLNFRQEIGGSIDLAAQALFSQRDIDQRHFSMDGVLGVPATNPFAVNPLHQEIVLVGYSFANDLGPIVSSGHTRYASGAIDVTLDLPWDWKARVSGAYSSQNLDVDVRNQVDFNALTAALADPDPATAFNPFGSSGQTNPDTVERIRLDIPQRAVSVLRTRSLTLDGAAGSLPAGPVKLAFGVEQRQESLWRGALAHPTNLGRHVTSEYAEALVPLLGSPENRRAAPRLALTAGLRSDQYSDFGGASFAPKVDMQAVLSPELKVRASWSQSYRAPSVIDLYNQSQNDAVMLQIADGRWVLITEGSNPHLRDEHATTYTAGLDLVPAALPAAMLSLTYFNTRYVDRVARLQPAVTPVDEVLSSPQYAGLVEYAPARDRVSAICHSEQFLGSPEQCDVTPIAALIDARARNDAQTETDGIDLSGKYSVDTPMGHVGVSTEGTYTRHFVQQVTATAPRVNQLDTVGYPLSKRFRTTLQWQEHASGASGFYSVLTFDWRDSYRDRQGSSLGYVGSWSTLDLSAGWRAPRDVGWGSGWELSVNANNLLNKDPPFVDREVGFDLANARPFGRILSITVSKSW